MTSEAISFDRYRLIPQQRKLLENGEPVRLGGRALDILVALADADGATVSARQLQEIVWPGIHVEQAALRVHISGLRRTLGRPAEGESFILNVPGRGYQLAAAVVREPAAPDLRSVERAPMRALPSVSSRVIGREELAARLCDDLPRKQFVTLVGAGGVGKTTLALDVAARLTAAYDQVALADLGAISSPELVGRTVALAFGLTLAVEDPTPAIGAQLRSGRSLLVLDNCEHVIEAAALFAERLCAAAPSVDILATSREPLRAQGEWIYRLPPLAAPSAGTAQSAAEALQYPSVELFVERAAARSSEFQFTDDAVAAVGEICRRLEGVPLAVELAASWSDVFPLRTLADRLDGHLLLRTLGRRSAPARQRTLRATIDWSHDLLAEPERRLFRRLSVFTGDFSLDAAVAVAADDTLAPDEVMDGVAALAAKSLISIGSRDGGRTYHLLMAPRAYAAERLEESGEMEAFRRRHAQWVLEELAEAEGLHPKIGHAAWVQRQLGLLDEVRAATAWALSKQGDVDVALELACATTPLWFRYSLTFEGRALCQTVRDALQARGKAPARDEMRLGVGLGVSLMYTRASHRDVQEVWTRVLSTAERLGDVETQMLGHWGLWLSHTFNGDRQSSLRHAMAFQPLAGRRGVGADIATGERMLASSRFGLGQIDAARAAVERMLRQLGQPADAPPVMLYQFEQAISGHSLLSRIHWVQGRPDEALAAARASVAAAEAAGHRLSLAYALLDGLAHMAVLTGNGAVAHEALDRHIAMPESQGIIATEAVEAMRAIALDDDGDLGGAMTILTRVFADPTKARVGGRFPMIIGRLAEILGRGGRPELGLALIEDTRERFLRDPADMAQPLLRQAEARLRSGDSGAEAGPATRACTG